MKGGSKASQLVMETNPKLCDDNVSPVIRGSKIEGNVENFSLYKTTGGGWNNKKKMSGKSKNNKKMSGKSKSKNNRKSDKGKKRSISNNNNKNSGKGKKRSISNNNSGNNNSGNNNSGKKKSGKRNSRRRLRGGSLASDLVMKGNNGCQKGGDRTHAGVDNGCLPGHARKMKGGNKSLRRKSLRKSKKLLRRRKQRGSGSDWKMTLYSRGPVNTPTQNPDEFRMFNQSSEFMSNESLRSGKFTK